MDFSNSFEMRPISNFDIEDSFKGITNLQSVYSKDMFPKRKGENESVVINTQDYLDGGGTHWVCTHWECFVYQPDSNDTLKASVLNRAML